MRLRLPLAPGFSTVAGNRIGDNVVIGAPVSATAGIACDNAQATTTGNVVSGFGSPITDGTSGGDIVNEF